MEIQKLIDKALEREPKQGSGLWKPHLFGRCYRAQFWARKDEPKSNPPDKRTLRIFKAGNLFEEFVVSCLPENEIITQVKVELPDVLGYADIVTDMEVVDVKSQHSRSFHYMRKCKDIVKDKYPNWLQVGFYAVHLDRPFMKLLFVSKDDLCIVEYTQKTTDWVGAVNEELEILRELWDIALLPPAAPRCWPKKDGTYSECKYCDWKDKCSEIERSRYESECK